MTRENPSNADNQQGRDPYALESVGVQVIPPPGGIRTPLSLDSAHQAWQLYELMNMPPLRDSTPRS